MQGLWTTVEDSGFYFQCLAKLLGFHKILLAVGMRIGREVREEVGAMSRSPLGAGSMLGLG